MSGKIGAPAGGRVHWLLWHLSAEFRRAHKLRFDYDFHNYHFTRYSSRFTPIDEYVIVRTSRRCFRCMYFNFETTYFEYFSEESSKAMAEHLQRFFRKIQAAERKRAET